MARPDDHETESGTNAVGWLALGLLVVITLLVIGFFVVDTVIGRQ